MFISHDLGKPNEKMNGEYMTAYANIPQKDSLTIVSQVMQDIDDPSIGQSIHFSAGVINRIERNLTLGCTLITDTRLIYTGIDRSLSDQLPVKLECFIDDPLVVSFAAQKRTTRAEIAMERALQISGPKMIVVGSAPMALSRLLQVHKTTPLREVTIVAAANGFANIVELKERVWESGLPCIVIRGRKGGAPAGIAITNALLSNAVSKLK